MIKSLWNKLFPKPKTKKQLKLDSIKLTFDKLVMPEIAAKMEETDDITMKIGDVHWIHTIALLLAEEAAMQEVFEVARNVFQLPQGVAPVAQLETKSKRRTFH